MSIRKIVNIDEEKCNGCGLCVEACHEGALQMIDGKARLIKDDYCDGLGDCLPECPTGAITISEREAADFDVQAVKQRMAQRGHESAKLDSTHQNDGQPNSERPAKFTGCPGSMQRTIDRPQENPQMEPVEGAEQSANDSARSQLRQWPVQLRLISSNAAYLHGAHLLLAADCTPFAFAGFHEQLLKGRVAIIACPKLDDYQQIVDKLADILRSNDIASITIARMEVPCCGGMTQAVKQAMLDSGQVVPFSERIITIEGELM